MGVRIHQIALTLSRKASYVWDKKIFGKNASGYLHVTKAKHIIASKRSESRHFIEKIGQNRLHH